MALVESGTIRVLDLLFISKDTRVMLSVEIDDLGDVAGFDQLQVKSVV